MPMNSYFAKTKNNFYGVWLSILIRSIKVLPNEWDFLIPNPIKIQRRVVDGNCERLTGVSVHMKWSQVVGMY